MKKVTLMMFALASLTWTACSSNNSDANDGDSIVTDSPMLDSAVSDSLNIKAAPADSTGITKIDTVK